MSRRLLNAIPAELIFAALIAVIWVGGFFGLLILFLRWIGVAP